MTPLLEIIMSFIASLPAGPQAWLFNSPLAPHMDAFGAHLVDGGYSAQTTRNHFLGAYFSPSWTAFQADRGRDFSVMVDGISN